MAEYRFDQIVINITEKKKPVEEDKYTYIGLEHLDSQNLKVSRWGSDIAPKGEKLVMKKGDVLFGKRRAYQKKVAIAPFDGIFSAHGMVLRPNEEIIDKNFFPLFISSDYFLDAAIKISVGSLSPTINWRDLKELKFQLPDLDKQKKLADMLWSINRTLLRYKELLNKTDELVKSQFIEMFGNPNKITNSSRLEEAFEIRNDLRKPLNDAVRSKMHTGELYPYYGANGQVDSINEYLMDCTALCLAEDCGAYGAGESTSYIIKGKSWVNNHAHVLIPLDCCDIEFANTYFKILDMTKFVTGTTRLKLTQGKMKEIPFLLPPLSDQKKFAAFVRQSDKSKFELEQTLSELNATYKRIIEENLG
ncbi:restriction endonuclease subunit S [Anaerosphaera multitolerans]|uniref:Restriction endonuclease subunit S n=1 Tax=Anaerosphaera multitolerans TaxID=2487351 RepID=A0A437SAD0_9FIRM|nr:restriction endonuclease subunit S [Anaerosphaera multitolerans]RVU55801.1 restriction endonuclease subunit S [Anaerosphaera multitolerans]